MSQWDRRMGGRGGGGGGGWGEGEGIGIWVGVDVVNWEDEMFFFY